MATTGTIKSPVKKLPGVHRETVHMSQQSLVRTSFLVDGRKLPLVIQPEVESLDLFEWAKENREYVDKVLRENGGILFRGFKINSHAAFERFLPAVSTELLNYIEGSTPRSHLSDKVYTSTEFPASQFIMLHNELNYVTTWPQRIWFCCLTAALTGGETPIADVRRVYQRIDPRIIERFKEKGWMLVRNFGTGLSLPWQKSFRTSDKTELENYCKAAEVQYEWVDDNHLRTWQVRPAVARHPITREWVWFNHVAFWHLSSLAPAVRESMLEVFSERDVPYNVFYGDGTPIENSVIENITDAYNQETVAFLWQEGDVLMLDNMLVAHGRNPFSGPRKVIVAMSDPCSDRGL
jgi:alpha-ketoglutarate-dependent taurine dioxygenase